MTPEDEFRILIVDDNPEIHRDFRKIFEREDRTRSDLDERAKRLLGGKSTPASNSPALPKFELISAYQGEEAAEIVRKYAGESKRFAMAFVDMRMPPGWDGLKTIRELWSIDDKIEIAICSAYSDHSWSDIRREIGGDSKLLILKKPFDSIEALQMANCLTRKWALARRAELEHERLDRKVEAATKSLVREQQSKIDFLANASHELLTPLNGVIGLTELLAIDEADEQRRDYLNEISSCSQTLQGLIEDILCFNDLEKGEVRLNEVEFNPCQLIERTASKWARQAEKKHILVRTVYEETLIELRGDSKKIEKIISELVENSVKFSDEGEIEIQHSVTTAPDSQCWLEVKISDDGPGIPDNRFEFIRGSRLTQADEGTTRKHGGLGMGITLVKGLCNALGAEFKIENKPSGGTVATIRCPVKQSLKFA